MKQMLLYLTGDFVDGPDEFDDAGQLRVSLFSLFENERKARRERIAQRNKNFKVRV